MDLDRPDYHAPILILATTFDWIGALLALFVLKPLRIRWVSGEDS